MLTKDEDRDIIQQFNRRMEEQFNNIDDKIIRLTDSYCEVVKPYFNGVSNPWNSFDSYVLSHQIYKDTAAELELEYLIPDVSFEIEDKPWGALITKRIPLLASFHTTKELVSERAFATLPINLLSSVRDCLVLMLYISQNTEYMPDVGFEHCGYYLDLPLLGIKRFLKQNPLSSSNIGIGVNSSGNLVTQIDTDTLFPKSKFNNRRIANTIMHTELGIIMLDALIYTRKLRSLQPTLAGFKTT